MDADVALAQLIDAIRPMAASPSSKELFLQLLGKAAIKVDANLVATHKVNRQHIQALVEHLDVRVAWKLAAKRVLRPHGITI
jgi:RNA-binding protein YlmH